ncbi:unnamed protein product [Prorocentrum cordatum]|uniref:PPPDE domain-containing protein n=1 Tax=Prorocentrum cordatum TaxID=2364126 RepID=A0ABN9X3T6_9DINO|nr:unnamed protein product [Polarella glacialis]
MPAPRRVQELRAGARVAVVRACRTNSREASELRAGQQGVVISIDPGGDALVDFDDLPLAEWVFRRNMHKLRVVEEGPAEDPTEDPAGDHPHSARAGCHPLLALAARWHGRKAAASVAPRAASAAAGARGGAAAAGLGELPLGPEAPEAPSGQVPPPWRGSAPSASPHPAGPRSATAQRSRSSPPASPSPLAWMPSSLRASPGSSSADALPWSPKGRSPGSPAAARRCGSPLMLLSRGRGVSPRVAEQVRLNIYDLGRGAPVQWANGVLCKIGTGAFHAGVEVYGREYSFGHRSDGSSGVVWCPPRGAEGHAFREAVDLGAVRLSKSQVQRLVGRMADEWPGRDYDLFRRNCCHFCEELCQRLGVARVPEYVFSLAAAGARIRDGVGVAVSSVGTAASTARSSMETLTSWDPDQKGRAIWTGAIQAVVMDAGGPMGLAFTIGIACFDLEVSWQPLIDDRPHGIVDINRLGVWHKEYGLDRTTDGSANFCQLCANEFSVRGRALCRRSCRLAPDQPMGIKDRGAQIDAGAFNGQVLGTLEVLVGTGGHRSKNLPVFSSSYS